jgi:hypothetical protein
MAKEGGMSRDMGMSKQMGMSNGHEGHFYLQTNEIRNSVIHYHRLANGTLTEVERVATRGAGSGTYKPISGQENAPNSFEGAGSVHPLTRSQISVCHKRRGQFGFQLRRRRPGQAQTYRALPNRWHILPRRTCFTWSTPSDPIISGSCRSPVMASSRRARSDTRRIHRRQHTVSQLWVCSHQTRNFSLSAPRSICPLRSLAPIRAVHQFSGCLGQPANSVLLLQMRRIPMVAIGMPA